MGTNLRMAKTRCSLPVGGEARAATLLAFLVLFKKRYNLEPKTRILLEELDRCSKKEQAGKLERHDCVEIMGLFRDGLRRKLIYEHSKRVASLSKLVGKKIGLGSQECRRLYIGALLHDVGKAFVSSRIIEKNEKPTWSEMEILRLHPQLGMVLVQRLAFLSPFANAIGQHQEKFDGSGYPHQLEGTQISLHARIIAVADAYDVLVNERPYKEAMENGSALETLRKDVGSHFDPKVFAAFERVLIENGAVRPKMPHVFGNILAEGIANYG